MAAPLVTTVSNIGPTSVESHHAELSFRQGSGRGGGFAPLPVTLSVLPPTPTEGTPHAMPPKRRITLPDDVRDALSERLRESKEASERTRESFFVDVYLMNRAGMTEKEIAEVLGVSPATVNDWKRKGEEARNRRSGVDPDRSGELTALG